MKTVKTKNEIKLGSLISYLSIFLSIGSGLVYTPWMIKTIGDTNYGLYMTAASLIGFFVMDFGISTAIAKFLSKFINNKEEEKIPGFLAVVYRLYFLIAAFLFIILFTVYLFLEVIYFKFSPAEMDTFRVLFGIAALYSVISFPFISFDGILISKEKFVSLKLCGLIQKAVYIILIIICLSAHIGVYSLVLTNAFSGLLVIFIKYLLIKKQGGFKVDSKYKNRELTKSLFGFSVWTTIIQIMQRFIFSIAPTILAIASNTHEIVLFSIASSLESYVFILSDAVNGMFLPKVTSIVFTSKNISQDLTNLMIKLGRLQTYLIFLVFVGFIACGKEFISSWMDSSYSLVYFLTILLIFPSVLNLPQQVGYTAVVVIDKIKIQSFVYIGMAIINIIISLILVPSLGALGMCIAICVAYLFRTIAMNVVFVKTLGIDLKRFYYETYSHVALPVLISLLLGILEHIFLNIFGGWVDVLIKGSLITIIYFVLVFFLSFNDYEKKMFTSSLRIFKKSC